MLRRRRRALGAASPLFYARPLHIVRGEGCWLWDADGRRYLDAYNNVPHVGHAHPHVVAAMAEQAALLNVHTRYLHPAILDYAERLLSRFDAPLDRLLPVCTGTEANELALRIAAAQTGARGVIVTDWSYHGNSATLARITTGLPTPEPFAPWARTVALPDPYHAGTCAAGLAAVDAAIAALQAAGHGVAAVLFDTIFSTEGLIDVPPGYVAGLADRVRAAGGLVIADEVQPGFGRVGPMMWGYRRHGIVPDIVTLGKPMGNGYPLAGVVTAAAIADPFGERALYFNTFAGTPVAARVGSAVLDVLDAEDLPARAARTGTRLRDGLAALARRLVEAMRARGILISRIGPRDNVLKIRPPLAFAEAEADMLVDTLASVLDHG